MSTPDRVFVFSGHIMDAPNRAKPRFPSSMESAAKRAIEATLEDWRAGARDLALCQAAAGGDLIFLEACLARQVPAQVMLPFEEREFEEQSILPATHGSQWLKRYHDVRSKLLSAPAVMSVDVGNPFERCNLWLLETAGQWGFDRVRLLVLWNGEAGDGPGGVAHMMRLMTERGGQVHWIDTRELATSTPH